MLRYLLGAYIAPKMERSVLSSSQVSSFSSFGFSLYRDREHRSSWHRRQRVVDLLMCGSPVLSAHLASSRHSALTQRQHGMDNGSRAAWVGHNLHVTFR